MITIRIANQRTSYWLNMSSMVVNKWGESKAAVFNEPLTVFLDSGAEYSYLPQHIIQPLIDATGATKYTKSAYSIECTSESIDGSPKFSGSVDFGFGNLTIHVPVQQLTNIDDYVEDSCILGVKQTNDPYDIPYVLGENFLRSAFGESSFEFPFPTVRSSYLLSEHLASRLRPRQSEYPPSSRCKLRHQSRIHRQGP
jgi:hypothetical protein